MEKLFKIVLVLHISGGAVGLIAGTINLVKSKGDKLHRKVGKAFLFAMITAGASSLLLSLLHPNYFLFMVGVFTLYLVGTGERYLYLRKLGEGQQPAVIDWILTLSMIVFGFGFMGLGAYQLWKGEQFGIVFLVFGFFGLRLAQKDVRYYRHTVDSKKFWLVAHLQRMIGCYIAALTAFLVVNNNTLVPPMVAWLSPTVILVPLIVRWSRHHRGEMIPVPAAVESAAKKK